MSKHVTADQVLEAIEVLDRASVSLCKALVKKYGTSRKAAAAIGVSTVHFCRMMGGDAHASKRLLEVMCTEAIP